MIREPKTTARCLTAIINGDGLALIQRFAERLMRVMTVLVFVLAMSVNLAGCGHKPTLPDEPDNVECIENTVNVGETELTRGEKLWDVKKTSVSTSDAGIAKIWFAEDQMRVTLFAASALSATSKLVASPTCRSNTSVSGQTSKKLSM